ncbi:P-loop containing nucleoside triphosphate hydrolase protein [Xylariomycetidae sp. FL0641]|nr:P-loop containing nucleoside triphosphate hydrolase protein [Xylariomycetidae sp. FL0641]
MDRDSSTPALTDDVAGGVPHPAFTDIGKRQKALNDAISVCQASGIFKITPLPELVLVGDQSSGKSSLMSALAQLDLPKSSGICTRCPFHIQMSSSQDEKFVCTVTLEQDYDYDAPANRRSITTASVTKKNPFPPWTRKAVREITHFKTINERTGALKVEEVLRWAQIAILNPSLGAERYVPGEGAVARSSTLDAEKGTTETKFSPNIVALQMKGRDLPNVSFFDLPGVFANSDSRADDYLVEVVKNLTEEYVRRPGAIVMLALPIDQDTNNSKTLKVIRDAHAEDRTIGIITKADKLTGNSPDAIESLTQWTAVMDGTKQLVGDGCFVTSLSPYEGVGYLEWEKKIFYQQERPTQKWRSFINQFDDRCGVSRLSPYISGKLGDAFTKSIPDLKRDIKLRLAEIQGVLANLPELPNNVEHEVKTSLQVFCRNIKEFVRGSHFESDWKLLSVQFYDYLVHMKPTCILKTEEAKKQGPIVIPDSDNETTTPIGNKRSASSPQAHQMTPKKPRLVSSSTPTKTKQETEAKNILSSTENSNPFSSLTQQRSKMHLKDIHLKTSAMSRFDNWVPIELPETICLEAIGKWQDPLDMLLEEAMSMLETAVRSALGDSLQNLHRRLIFKESRQHLDQFLAVQKAAQKERIAELFKIERHRMQTINRGILEHFSAKELENLEHHRAISRLRALLTVVPCTDQDGKALSLDQIAPEERSKEKKRLSEALARLPEDPYKPAMKVAVHVRAYYLVAAARFADTVTMDIIARLFAVFRDTALDRFLEEKLGLLANASPGDYNRLMEEDDNIAQTRDNLKKEEANFLRALDGIVKLEGATAANDKCTMSQASSATDFDEVM